MSTCFNVLYKTSLNEYNTDTILVVIEERHEDLLQLRASVFNFHSHL